MRWIQKLKGFFKKTEDKRERGARVERDLISQAIKELDKLRDQKQDVKFLENLNRIFRIFIKEKYEIKRGLTYEELTKEITQKKMNEKIKNKIIDIASKIHQNTYKSNLKKSKRAIGLAPIVKISRIIPPTPVAAP